MVDTVTNTVLDNSARRLVVSSTIQSDGTGSTDAVLVDKSTFVGPDGTEPGRLAIERIEYMVDGMQVLVEFEHTTDDVVAVLAGNGYFDYAEEGMRQGFVDPASAGGTGDIVGTTVGHTAGDRATIVFYLRKKD